MINEVNVEFEFENGLPEGTKFNAKLSPSHLLKYGFVVPIIVQTPSAYITPSAPSKLKAITVMALLDTGASCTCISQEIAKILELVPVGYSEMSTAAGIAKFPEYAVDILFPNTSMKGFENLSVGTCALLYNHDLPPDAIMDKSNFGVLIGRDIMSRWNIVWNGPTSSVFITE